MSIEGYSLSAVNRAAAALPVASAGGARMGSQQGDDVVVLAASRSSEQEPEQDKEVEEGRHLFERAFRRRKESSRAVRESSSPPAVEVDSLRQIPTEGHDPNARPSVARSNGSGAASQQHVHEHGQATWQVNAGAEHDGELELLIWLDMFPDEPNADSSEPSDRVTRTRPHHRPVTAAADRHNR